METDKKKINVELLERVKAHILEEPTRFDMGNFLLTGDEVQRFVSDFARPAPPCGTIACIAGWAVLLSEPKFDGTVDELEERAVELLGLSHVQAKCLFYSSEWPEDFEQSYNETEDVDPYQPPHRSPRRASSTSSRRRARSNSDVT